MLTSILHFGGLEFVVPLLDGGAEFVPAALVDELCRADLFHEILMLFERLVGIEVVGKAQLVIYITESVCVLLN